jgi:hypothetical protein
LNRGPPKWEARKFIVLPNTICVCVSARVFVFVCVCVCACVCVCVVYRKKERKKERIKEFHRTFSLSRTECFFFSPQRFVVRKGITECNERKWSRYWRGLLRCRVFMGIRNRSLVCQQERPVMTCFQCCLHSDMT